ncbi:hypothetical protein AVEN_156410-1 [Araneus ventricosus]|uniref:Uncharacterized protein n=1 Tax=Araneus ventricosus TaxID=182803 RepID=A0A4Y2CV54_ARAVE|nr:hypothetical protein AVEN_156410-1 [Araneus ventricosus]
MLSTQLFEDPLALLPDVHGMKSAKHTSFTLAWTVDGRFEIERTVLSILLFGFRRERLHVGLEAKNCGNIDWNQRASRIIQNEKKPTMAVGSRHPCPRTYKISRNRERIDRSTLFSRIRSCCWTSLWSCRSITV